MAVFTMAALMAPTGSWASEGALPTGRATEWFIAFATCTVAMRKLRDIASFSPIWMAMSATAVNA